MKQSMKGILTGAAGVMVFLPWTILLLRRHEWALKSPAAEITIGCYAVFMILAGIFTFAVYMKGKVQNPIMKICLVVNELYAMAGGMALVMMGVGKIF
ncbi:hypothetical protein AALD74_15390 [Lachnospiraceae bacterium 48-21]|jgi:hypothetical protein